MKIVKALFKSMGGVHPKYRKDVTAALPIDPMPHPKSLLVSLAQHIGAPSNSIVKKGDSVELGQPIGEAGGFVSSWVHAPVSGTVKAVEELPTASGRTATVVEIEDDGLDRVHASVTALAGDWKTQDKKALIERVSQAGVIGMGGAGFPTHVKLSPPATKPIDTLILNGAECEPYLTADHRLMLEQADRIWAGAEIIRHILGAKSVRVAIEDNKPDAIRAMEKALAKAEGDVEIVELKTEYPQGAEKQLIYSALGREVPSGGLPMDVGAVVENVATATAVYDAIVKGLPLTERVLTVTGDCVKYPKNVLAKVGTRLTDILEFCGGLTAQPGKIISGGPMMGLSLFSLDAGTNKTTSGLLLLAREQVEAFNAMPCIACGRCVGACPMRLLPCTLSECMEIEDYKAAESFDVMDCIECGSCAFECPARRPLVQHMKQGKIKVMALRKQREAPKTKGT